jgi:hypothetical protein
MKTFFLLMLCLSAAAADLGRIGGGVFGGDVSPQRQREIDAKKKAEQLRAEQMRVEEERARIQAESASVAALAAQIQWTSIWFAGHPEWRASEGIVFNTKKAPSWSSVSGNAIDVQSGILIFEKWSETEGAIREGITNYIQSGLFSVSNLNQRTALGVKADWKVDAVARYIGKFKWRGDTLNLYDYGTTPTQAEIETLKSKLG